MFCVLTVLKIAMAALVGTKVRIRFCLFLVSLSTASEMTPVGMPANCNEVQVVDLHHLRNYTIYWEESIMNDNRFYYSDPLCVDEKGWYVLRECDRGMFPPVQPKCHSLQNHKYACMDNLMLYDSQDEEKGERITFCYTMSEQPMSFEDKFKFQCPYKQVDARSNWHMSFCKAFPEFPIWLPYHRRYNSTYRLNAFVPDAFPILDLEFIEWEDDIIDISKEDRKCLSCSSESSDGNRTISVDCNQKRYHVCTYRAIPLNMKDESMAVQMEANFCQEVDKECRISWEVNSIKCICPKKIKECYTPAVYPIATYDTAIGVKIDEQGALIWTSTKDKVKNTFWSITNLISRRSRNIQYIVWKENGWVFRDEQNIDSYIMCEQRFEIPSPEISIGYSGASFEPSLDIRNSRAKFSTWDIDGDRYDGMCHLPHGFSLCFIQLINSPVPGSWQCDIVDLADTSKKITSNAVDMDFGRFVFQVQFEDNYKKSNMQKLFYEVISKLFNKVDEFYNSGCHVEQVLDKESDWIEIVCHLSVKDTEQTREKYTKLKNILYLPQYTEFNAQVFNLEYCHGFKVTQKDHELSWPKAMAGEESQSACYDEKQERMRIKCLRNITIGSRFTAVPTCVSCDQSKSDEIEDLEHSEAPPEEIVANLTTILKEEDYAFTSDDYHITANILEKLSQKVEVDSVMKVVSTLMGKESSVLKESQQKDNVTDRVLSSLDVALRATVINASQEIRKSDSIDCIFVDKNTSMYAGAATLETGKVKWLEQNLTLADVLEVKGLESAVYIMHNGFGYASIAMFKTAGLFNELNKSIDAEYSHADNNVFGVLVPEDAVDIKVILVFKRQSANATCAYWRYGGNQYGAWHVADQNGGHNITSEKHLVCVYNHTTHFGQLIMQTSPLGSVTDQILTMMTAILCGFSSFGLCAILATGVIFPHWRESNITLLHYSVVLLVQTILLFVNTNVHMETTVCIVAGAVLHFTVLSQFCWMFTIAVHRYYNLTRVFTAPPTFFSTQWVMLFTYGAPLLIIGVALSVNIKSYIIYARLNLCYPSGDIFSYTLLLPIAAIATVNACIFLWIMYSLFTQSKSKVILAGNCFVRNLDKIRVFCVMLFTLGITWWFGFAALLLNNGFLLYLFSITTAMQGFILFLFYVLRNEKLRAMYLRKYHVWTLSKSYA